MESLRKGNFYASLGPRFYSIDYEPETGMVTVECSKDVHAVVFKSNTPWPAFRLTFLPSWPTSALKRGEVSHKMTSRGDKSAFVLKKACNCAICIF